MTNDQKQKAKEKKGYKFTFVHSTATTHLKKAPVIVYKFGFFIGKYNSLTAALKDL